MRDVVPFYTDTLYEPADDSRTLFLTFAFSLACHLVFFLMLVFAPNIIRDRKVQNHVINVSMVTLPAQQYKAPQRDTIKRNSKTPIIHESSSEPQSSKRVNNITRKSVKAIPSTASHIKVKRSLKKKTFKSTKIVKNAISRLEKKIDDSRPDAVKKAIDELKKKTGKALAIDQIKDKVEKGPQIPGGSAVGNQQALKLIDLYRYEIALKVQQNWAYSNQLAGAKDDLVAELAFTVMPNGEIRDIWFDRRSGNRYLDDSARKAVMKSNPVSPHPPGVGKAFITIGLRFTPKGVK